MKKITEQPKQAQIDLDEVAAWVGLHYGRNFEVEPQEKRKEWIERYAQAHGMPQPLASLEVTNFTGDPINVTIQAGILTMPDGQAIDLTKIQAAINFGFQKTGEKELIEACDLMSKIAGLEKGHAVQAEATQSCEHLKKYVQRIADLNMWGYDKDDGDLYQECEEPDDGHADSHACLMDLIEMARKL